ncbi:hypothetical protein RUM44_010037 [Polyplax serrata]|uniref:UBP-type domain-containing protein n=1 Tax=Polyplax serrata TaxID=468196 RepID=A0ABR1AUE1_POLSC
MDKFTSDKPSTRRSPRTCATASNALTSALMTAKENMKLRMKKGQENEFIRDDYATAQNAKQIVRKNTGIVYNDEMTKHFCTWDENYPECPERFTAILQRCKELNLIERCTRIQSREATQDELLSQHTYDSIRLLKETQEEKDPDKLEKLSSQYDSIFINNDTYNCALLAAGSSINLVDAICKGEIQNGMAIVRPPGHHAMRHEYCGYCFFNNVALAAKHALTKCGIEKILIVDWDVHHGQGTQKMFYETNRVVYFSIHRYDNGSFWPELRESDYYFVGENGGKGHNFNIPLNKTGMKDADYLAIFQQVLLPMAYEFQPQLIIVSAGYDAALNCPEGQMEVSPACFAHLLTPLMGLAEGKVAVILEGGYCMKSLAEGAALTLRCLLGDPAPSLLDFSSPCDSIVDSILNVIYVQKPYWQCFQNQDVFEVEAGMKMRKRSTEKIVATPMRKHFPIVKFQGDESRPSSYPTRNCYPVQQKDLNERLDKRLNYLKMVTDLKVPSTRVAIAFDERMTEHRNSQERNHPEKPERLTSILQMYRDYGLMERCTILKPRVATEEEILLVHTQSHVNDMKDTSNMTVEELNKKGSTYDSIYLHPKSYECALMAAGSVLEVVDAVVNGDARSGVAVVRPPGHHAEDDTACGFCLFNNVSVAAKYAIDVHSLDRVLLIDWDVHHGNGTQKIFEADRRVLYISLHRYNNGKFFPSSTDANYDKVGVGSGEGYNINIPWNKAGGGLTDGDYIAAFMSVVMPVAYQYNPQLVLVSAGFDACINDPLGHCKITPEAYAHMTHWLTTLANGRVILSLEGGYNVTSISYAMTMCTKALLGDPLPPLTGANIPCSSAVESIKNVLRTQEKYWPCLKFNAALPKDNILKNCTKHVEERTNVVKSENLSNEVNDNLVEKLQEISFDNVTVKGDQGFSGAPEDGNPRDAHSREGRTSRDSDQDSGATRPITQTLVGYLSDNMQRLLNQEMFAVVPLPGCPHLVQVQAVPPSGIDVNTPCATCESIQENWICLICYSVFCGRYVSQHMVFHNEESSHPLTLSFSDLSVWCYVCEAYIDNMILYPAKNAVHRSKFGSDLEWSYGDRTPPTRLSDR